VYTGLGIWALAEAEYDTGAFWLAIGVAWMLHAFFRNDPCGRRGVGDGDWRRSTGHGRSRRSRTTSPAGTAQTILPVGTRTRLTDEPANWSEIGRRTKDPSPT